MAISRTAASNFSVKDAQLGGALSLFFRIKLLYSGKSHNPSHSLDSTWGASRSNMIGLVFKLLYSKVFRSFTRTRKHRACA
jgi:hypothetical protein